MKIGIKNMEHKIEVNWDAQRKTYQIIRGGNKLNLSRAEALIIAEGFFVLMRDNEEAGLLEIPSIRRWMGYKNKAKETKRQEGD